jgi:steroid 5-alpha reductase family enzyme
VWLIAFGAMPASSDGGVVGAVLITLLFLFVSIPMMERRLLASKPGYAAYRKEVSALVPFFRRRPKKEGATQA